MSSFDKKAKKFNFNIEEINKAMFSFLKQNAGVFSYQDVIQWSLEEFFSWLSISNKYIMEERKAYEQARQKAKLER